MFVNMIGKIPLLGPLLLKIVVNLFGIFIRIFTMIMDTIRKLILNNHEL